MKASLSRERARLACPAQDIPLPAGNRLRLHGPRHWWDSFRRGAGKGTRGRARSPWMLAALILLVASPLKAEALTEADFTEILSSRFSSRPVKVYDDQESWMEERKGTFRGTFELETSLTWNPKVRVRYRVPQTHQKHNTPAADNIVMLCLWYGAAQPPESPAGKTRPKHGKPALKINSERPTDGKTPKKKAPVEKNLKLHGYMSPFSDGLGFTTFSLEIVTDENDFGNKKECYFYGGPEWVDVVRRAKAEIVKRHKLHEKKLLLYGSSMGGSFAAHLAAAMPDEVAAVAIHNAPDVPTPAARSETKWFVGVTRGDSGRQGNESLVRRLRELGTPVVHAITPPAYQKRGVGNLYHSLSGAGRHAGLSFLEGAVEQRSTQGENDPTRWPYVRDLTKPLLIRRNDRQMAGLIPESRREYLPSAKLARALQSMPPSMQTVTMEAKNSANPRCMVGLPPLGQPKGAILLSHKYQFHDLPQLLDNINFLAGKGYVVLAPRLWGEPAEVLQTSLNFVRRNPLLANLPLSLIGVGAENAALWQLLLTQRGLQPAAFIPIDFQPGDFLDRSTWPLGAKIQWPTLFLYDQKNFAQSGTSAKAREAAAKLEKVREFVEFMRKKNQIAAVRFVPLGQISEDQSAQKSIETALQFINLAVSGKIRTEFK